MTLISKVINGEITENHVYVKFDVASLYSNISHEHDTETRSFWLETERNKLNSCFPREFIIDAMNIILENNFKDSYGYTFCT